MNQDWIWCSYSLHLSYDSQWSSPYCISRFNIWTCLHFLLLFTFQTCGQLNVQVINYINRLVIKNFMLIIVVVDIHLQVNLLIRWDLAFFFSFLTLIYYGSYLCCIVQIVSGNKLISDQVV